ncbi:hypothetical protein IHE45_10G043600 [Dioscorea alata]|uniref:Uncharacterized protein n=1 Tax=Dioscorea alata TaxID=55571 RepID=A0ACB7VAX6_DIOAL|nr:hypothetical protein IHE45_10G043600 [Dioscorea alata]
MNQRQRSSHSFICFASCGCSEATDHTLFIAWNPFPLDLAWDAFLKTSP